MCAVLAFCVDFHSCVAVSGTHPGCYFVAPHLDLNKPVLQLRTLATSLDCETHLLTLQNLLVWKGIDDPVKHMREKIQQAISSHVTNEGYPPGQPEEVVKAFERKEREPPEFLAVLRHVLCLMELFDLEISFKLIPKKGKAIQIGQNGQHPFTVFFIVVAMNVCVFLQGPNEITPPRSDEEKDMSFATAQDEPLRALEREMSVPDLTPKLIEYVAPSPLPGLLIKPHIYEEDLPLKQNTGKLHYEEFLSHWFDILQNELSVVDTGRIMLAENRTHNWKVTMPLAGFQLISYWKAAKDKSHTTLVICSASGSPRLKAYAVVSKGNYNQTAVDACVDVSGILCDFGILCGCVRLWHFVWMCATLAFCADVCDFGILCGCVRLWHFVRMCATLAFCVDVCDFGILCGCVRFWHFVWMCASKIAKVATHPQNVNHTQTIEHSPWFSSSMISNQWITDFNPKAMRRGTLL
jgi:hypothetical protein